MMRLRGVIQQMDTRPLTQEDDGEAALPDPDATKHRKILEEKGGADFAHVVGNDECRFRVNLLQAARQARRWSPGA